jgi:hypothetical protein
MDLCKQIGAESLYTVYGALSGHVHPTVTTSNAFLRDDGQLSLEPLSGYSSISIVAHCLIWAERDFARIDPGTPDIDGLERLAREINARPCPPPYDATAQVDRRSKRKSDGPSPDHSQGLVAAVECPQDRGDS